MKGDPGKDVGDGDVGKLGGAEFHTVGDAAPLVAVDEPKKLNTGEVLGAAKLNNGDASTGGIGGRASVSSPPPPTALDPCLGVGGAAHGQEDRTAGAVTGSVRPEQSATTPFRTATAAAGGECLRCGRALHVISSDELE